MRRTDTIQFEQREGPGHVAILRVKGRLDGETSPLLLQRCARIQSGGQAMVLNLSGVTFLGSSGVGALLVLAEPGENSPPVRFAALSETAQAVVELLDLTQFLMLEATEESAVAALARKVG